MSAPRIRRMLARGGIRLGLLLLALGVGHVLLLRHARVLFPWSVREGNLALYSDTPFDEEDGRAVLRVLRQRLEAEPLYSPAEHHSAFVCNTGWRRRLCFLPNRHAAGLNYAPLTRNVFLSGGRIRENRLVNPAGRVVGGELTLAHFIGHEIGHSLMEEHLGAWRYFAGTESWLKEAYADRVARGSVLARPSARNAYLAEAPEMNWPAQAPYLRYNLLLAHLLEDEQLPLEEIARQRISRPEAEMRLRKHLAASPPPG